MKSNNLIILALIGALVGCSPKQANEAKSSADPVGSWRSNLEYENSRFGILVRFPKEWTLKKGDDTQFAAKAANVLTDDKSFKRDLKAQLDKVHLIVQATRYPLGTPGKFNPNVIMLVEPVGDQPGTVSAAEYLKGMEQTLKQSNVNVTFTAEPHDVDLGGVVFSHRAGVIAYGTATIRQKYFARKEGPYIFVVSTTTMSADDDAEVKPILDSISGGASKK